MGSRLKLSIFVVLISLSLFSPADAKKAHHFTIIQMNDVYEIFPVPTYVSGHFEPRGGFAYAGTLIREARERGPVLFLHAGDFLSPSLLSIRFKQKGAHMVAALGALGLDVVTFGNHEFDFGCQVLADRIKESRFDWVSANVNLPKELGVSSRKVVPYRIKNIAGLRVGIFGLTIPLQPIDCKGSAITFDDPMETAKEMVIQLRRERVDLMIALTHLAMEDDRRLALAYPDIDFIVGGHDHEEMVELVGKTLITKAGANAAGLGLIGVKAARTSPNLVVEKSWRTEPVDPKHIQPDAALTQALEPYAKQLEGLSGVIGRAEVPIDIREKTVREGESNFGNYVADLMRKELQTDIGLVNGGAFRGDRIIPAGPLTLEDLDTILLFDNQLVVIPVKGEELLRCLENGVSLAGERAGRFPQVSGISFSFDATLPVGQRILQVKVGGVPLDLQKIYTMVTTDFLVGHGNMDGYELPDEIIQTGGDLNELIMRNIGRTPIRNVVEGRIVKE